MQTEYLSAENVLEFLDQQESSLESAEKSARRLSYLQAAAVLATIADVDGLRPIDSTSSPSDARNLLADDLLEVPGSDDTTFMLTSAARNEGLGELRTRERMLKALEANPQERRGQRQEIFEACLRGDPMKLGHRSLEELTAVLQALVWLDGFITPTVSMDELGDRLEFQRFLAPFEALAGDHVFKGRTDELDALRSYVGVLAPEQLLNRITHFFQWSDPKNRGALTVFGPGGIGKSALIMRFLLEHARLPGDTRIPFAYIDFDNTAFDVSDPFALAVEVIRQVQMQFPEEFRRLNDFARKSASPINNSNISQYSDQRIRSALSLLSDLFGIMQSRLESRPCLIVLDSFEEAQYRGEERATPMWQVLSAIQRRAPFLRVVISGRVAVKNLKLEGGETEELEIGPLKGDAVLAYLHTQGVTDTELAKKIASLVGGIPLSLKLAASLVKKSGGIDAVVKARGSRFMLFVSEDIIQGQLYERILGHIHDERVVRLAYPGLVLRRVTPEVILRVLNEPCHLGLESPEDALALFEELAREVSLVTSTTDELSSEPVLVHRSDLRRVMLKLLQRKEPALVRKIHRSAVDWYEKRDSIRARAEYAYHMLQLEKLPPEHLLRHPDIQFSLQASLAELPEKMQTALLSFGYRVSPDLEKKVSGRQRETMIAEEIERNLPQGQRGLEICIEKIDRAKLETIDYSSPIFRAAGRVAVELDERRMASERFERGLELAVEEGNTEEVARLLGDLCWQDREWMKPTEYRESLVQLEDAATRQELRELVWQQRLQQWLVDVSADPRITHGDRLLTIVRQFSAIEMWNLFPAVAAAFATADKHHAVRESGDPLIACLLKALFDDSGPFRSASWLSSGAQNSYGRLLDLTFEEEKHSITASMFRKYFVNLQRNWPYRNLRVRPPYVRGHASLRESLA